MQLIFATNNPHKVKEMQLILGAGHPIISLQQAGIHAELPEPFDTLEKNASAKSKKILELSGRDCFSEDTGLEVTVLGGRPGVKTARYAGEHAGAEENNRKLLAEMKDQADRSAQFRTVISLRLDGREYLFEGICMGRISEKMSGIGGFGYDPLFIPEGFHKTFAEMNEQEKAKLSHRALAAGKMVAFLNL
jgi:XTP/dITP diphosphohydrolase